MCFSPLASFGAAGLLAIIGALTLRKAQTFSQRPFAAIPLLFAGQQIAEGFVWLSAMGLVHDGYFVATRLFLLIAFVLWPVWIPFSLFVLEQAPIIKRVLLVFILGGAFFAGTVLRFVFMPGVHAQVVHGNLVYELPVITLWLSRYGLTFYIIVTILPLLISTVPRMRWFGVLIASAFIITYQLWFAALISVWCFFAALTSMGVYWVLMPII